MRAFSPNSHFPLISLFFMIVLHQSYTRRVDEQILLDATRLADFDGINSSTNDNNIQELTVGAINDPPLKEEPNLHSNPPSSTTITLLRPNTLPLLSEPPTDDLLNLTSLKEKGDILLNASQEILSDIVTATLPSSSVEKVNFVITTTLPLELISFPSTISLQPVGLENTSPTTNLISTEGQQEATVSITSEKMALNWLDTIQSLEVEPKIKEVSVSMPSSSGESISTMSIQYTKPSSMFIETQSALLSSKELQSTVSTINTGLDTPTHLVMPTSNIPQSSTDVISSPQAIVSQTFEEITSSSSSSFSLTPSLENAHILSAINNATATSEIIHSVSLTTTQHVENHRNTSVSPEITIVEKEQTSLPFTQDAHENVDKSSIQPALIKESQHSIERFTGMTFDSLAQSTLNVKIANLNEILLKNITSFTSNTPESMLDQETDIASKLQVSIPSILSTGPTVDKIEITQTHSSAQESNESTDPSLQTSALNEHEWSSALENTKMPLLIDTVSIFSTVQKSSDSAKQKSTTSSANLKNDLNQNSASKEVSQAPAHTTLPPINELSPEYTPQTSQMLMVLPSLSPSSPTPILSLESLTSHALIIPDNGLITIQTTLPTEKTQQTEMKTSIDNIVKGSLETISPFTDYPVLITSSTMSKAIKPSLEADASSKDYSEALFTLKEDAKTDLVATQTTATDSKYVSESEIPPFLIVSSDAALKISKEFETNMPILKSSTELPRRTDNIDLFTKNSILMQSVNADTQTTTLLTTTFIETDAQPSLTTGDQGQRTDTITRTSTPTSPPISSTNSTLNAVTFTETAITNNYSISNYVTLREDSTGLETKTPPPPTTTKYTHSLEKLPFIPEIITFESTENPMKTTVDIVDLPETSIPLSETFTDSAQSTLKMSTELPLAPEIITFESTKNPMKTTVDIVELSKITLHPSEKFTDSTHSTIEIATELKPQKSTFEMSTLNNTEHELTAIQNLPKQSTLLKKTTDVIAGSEISLAISDSITSKIDETTSQIFPSTTTEDTEIGLTIPETYKASTLSTTELDISDIKITMTEISEATNTEKEISSTSILRTTDVTLPTHTTADSSEIFKMKTDFYTKETKIYSTYHTTPDQAHMRNTDVESTSEVREFTKFPTSSYSLKTIPMSTIGSPETPTPTKKITTTQEGTKFLIPLKTTTKVQSSSTLLAIAVEEKTSAKVTPQTLPVKETPQVMEVTTTKKYKSTTLTTTQKGIKKQVNESTIGEKEIAVTTAVSVGLILMFILILFCVFGAVLVSGWFHCRRKQTTRQTVNLIHVERRLASEFDDSWTKGPTKRNWMTSESRSSFTPPPPLPFHNGRRDPVGVSDSLDRCNCKRRHALFGQKHTLCMHHRSVERDDKVKPLRIIQLRDTDDDEEEDDSRLKKTNSMLLNPMHRRRVSGASMSRQQMGDFIPPLIRKMEGGKEETGSENAVVTNEWLFIDEV